MKIALPWRLTETEMEIAWDQLIFDNTLLGQVPEEGVSRLVTQQISERRDHYVRYGLAFMLEHGFMKTDRGRLVYRMNLEQIRNAILETAYLGVLDAYMRCKRPSFAGGMRYGMSKLSGTRLRAALAQEVRGGTYGSPKPPPFGRTWRFPIPLRSSTCILQLLVPAPA